MKKSIAFLPTVIIVLLFSCTKDSASVSADEIVGVWSYDKNIHIETDLTNSTTLSNDTSICSSACGTVNFRSDGTFSESNDPAVTFHYKVQNDKLVTWNSDPFLADTVRILTLNSNNLILYDEGSFFSYGINIKYGDWIYLSR